ncbi:prolyl oligopeptidase family serine peptidase [Blastopirellula sp. J2-11]|uniref:prolyl oligopeptidase family serine peptidase n=1 Tax=Blastopirellula sp. J2-11 TaxID=2943192 RepID=UPI0021C9CB2F|nr:prolyl oligopeptidase family serine peptidase [Blastopirellula sp. J2-11]UUO05421.1 prolyl oligopeptidase family serine peptidase [Blastopirellula sp. J2-11]
MMLRIAVGAACTWLILITAPLAVVSGEESTKAESVSSETDPYAWLEDVEGEQALDWVRARNALSQAKLESDPSFEQLRDDLLAIFDSNERIPFVRKRGDFYYNFWRDEKNERGVWRRTTLDEYKKEEPQWEVLLDLDELAKAENENWVWSGAQLLRPDYTRCLLSMSRGGADADVTREFDLTTRKFVEDGFNRPEAKGGMSWIDIDHVFISTDFGPGSLTSSGYPRIAKLWTRGVKLEEAKVVYEGALTDLSISASHDNTPGYERNFVRRAIAFYNNEIYLLKEDGSLAQIEAPNSAGKGVHRDYLTLELRDAWTVGDKTYAAGSLIVANFDDFMAGKREFTVLFEPNDRSALSGYSFTKDYLLLNVLEDVASKLLVMKAEADGSWTKTPLVGAPTLGKVSVSPVDPDESNDYFMTSTDYLTPTTLYMGEVGKEPEVLKSMPEFFDATGLKVTQHFATSKDGTQIPYFMLYRDEMKYDGGNPTLLYGYGGFEVSLQPGYRATVGRAWSTQGGVYVVANIRGGGEYGPRWHQAALKEKRLKAYEDFAAVAQDLIDRKVTSTEHLGIQGGSNGGLLVGNMVALYPDLFKAAVCQVPLLDMKRYSHLLAGASWMAEYGNPDVPEEWEFIRTYSPYHNVKADVDYPTVFFTTSTRDDRVHPGHARKMFAKMEAWGKDVLYYENIEGGHGGAANNRQSAFMTAMAFTFLKQQLFPPAKE